MATTTDSVASAEAPMEESAAEAARAAARARESSRFPYRTIAMGVVGSIVMLLAAPGAAGTLVRDPIIGTGPLSWMRYGHGHVLSTAVLYVGFALVVWAWVRLGRYVLAGRIGTKPILVAAFAWMAPLLIAPPL
ncbi:MAG: hypothetical protein ACOX8C_13580, partial [Saccharomonospora viridis]